MLWHFAFWFELYGWHTAEKMCKWVKKYAEASVTIEVDKNSKECHRTFPSPSHTADAVPKKHTCKHTHTLQFYDSGLSKYCSSISPLFLAWSQLPSHLMKNAECSLGINWKASAKRMREERSRALLYGNTTQSFSTSSWPFDPLLRVLFFPNSRAGEREVLEFAFLPSFW